MNLDDDVIQLYTSGTTGHPKGVQISNANYLSLWRVSQDAGWADFEIGDVSLVCMPVFHIAGTNMGVLTLAQGGTAVILKEVDPGRMLELIPQYRVNHLFVVPAVILFMLQHPLTPQTDFSSLKRLSYGASPIAEELLHKARAVFGCPFVQLYGLTETTGGGAYLPDDAHDPSRGKLRACGVPYPGIEIRILNEAGQPLPPGEVGEIVIKSPVVMKGYWNRPEATAQAIRDGWFHTGDAGYFDTDGFLYIHDRLKDMIVSGGENIYPAEVENAVFGHPAVADVAVIGVPDDKWGEAVKAIVVLKAGDRATPEDIIAYARTRIAGYKIPKSVDFAVALPRNPSGKILRRELREPYWV
ncbi:MAG: AMP-binding protein, partial [Gammaproteobacteria bacterium]